MAIFCQSAPSLVAKFCQSTPSPVANFYSSVDGCSVETSGSVGVFGSTGSTGISGSVGVIGTVGVVGCVTCGVWICVVTAPFVPFTIIFDIASYVSLDNNVVETTFPFRDFVIYVSVFIPFAPFCFTCSVPTGNVLSSIYCVDGAIVDITFVDIFIVYSFSSFIP